MRLSDIHVPEPWTGAADRMAGGLEPVLVLGPVDTGKTMLVRYLLGRWLEKRGAAALLDGDVGMAMSGPPGLVGLTLVRDVDTLGDRAGADRSWFVGSTSPRGALVPIVLGHARLGALARAERLPVVVNTTGLVSGSESKELQLAIVDVIEPKLVIGLASDGGLEHLLRPIERRGLTVLRLPPSPRARPKPRSERSQLCAERFARHFEQATPRPLRLEDFCLEGTLLGSGTPLDDAGRAAIEQGLDSHVIEAELAGDAVALVLASAPHEEGAAAAEKSVGGRRLHVIEAAETSGLLLGLLAADGECLGLARLIAWHGSGTLEVETTLDDATLKQATRLALGSIRLGRNGEEIGVAARERTLTAEPA